MEMFPSKSHLDTLDPGIPDVSTPTDKKVFRGAKPEGGLAVMVQGGRPIVAEQLFEAEIPSEVLVAVTLAVFVPEVEYVLLMGLLVPVKPSIPVQE